MVAARVKHVRSINAGADGDRFARDDTVSCLSDNGN
jgi:hypothetical protein